MMQARVRTFESPDTEAVIALWEDCGLTRPWNDPHRDIERKLTVQPEMFLVIEKDHRIVATVMAGYDGHRGWMNYLAVAPDARRRGYARALIERVETLLEEHGCPKLNLQLRNDNTEALAFYEALGYAPDEVISLGKRLITDAPHLGETE